MDWSEFARVGVIFFGGAVVGGGAVVLRERAAFYGRAGIFVGRWAMLAMFAMNTLTLSFVAGVMIDRWERDLSWPWVLALMIFLLKALFFHLLRLTGIEQERRRLYGGL